MHRQWQFWLFIYLGKPHCTIFLLACLFSDFKWPLTNLKEDPSFVIHTFLTSYHCQGILDQSMEPLNRTVDELAAHSGSVPCLHPYEAGIGNNTVQVTPKWIKWLRKWNFLKLCTKQMRLAALIFMLLVCVCVGGHNCNTLLHTVQCFIRFDMIKTTQTWIKLLKRWRDKILHWNLHCYVDVCELLKWSLQHRELFELALCWVIIPSSSETSFTLSRAGLNVAEQAASVHFTLFILHLEVWGFRLRPTGGFISQRHACVVMKRDWSHRALS